MASGEHHPVSHMIGEHVEEYQYVREKQVILLEFLSQNLHFTQIMLSENPDMNNYFHIHSDKLGKAYVCGTRGFYLKCYNQVENIITLSQSENLKKTSAIKMTDLHKGGDGCTYKDEILNYFFNLELFGEAFYTSLDEGENLHNGLIFNYVLDKHDIDPSTPSIEIIEGQAILLATDERCLGLGEYVIQWFESEHQDFIKWSKKVEKVRSESRARAINLAEKFNPNRSFISEEAHRMEQIKYQEDLHASGTFARGPSSEDGEYHSSTDEEGNEPKSLVEALYSKFRKIQHRQPLALITSFQQVITTANDYEFTALLNHIHDNMDKMHLAPHAFWVNLTIEIISKLRDDNSKTKQSRILNTVIAKIEFIAQKHLEIEAFCSSFDDGFHAMSGDVFHADTEACDAVKPEIPVAEGRITDEDSMDECAPAEPEIPVAEGRITDEDNMDECAPAELEIPEIEDAVSWIGASQRATSGDNHRQGTGSAPFNPSPMQ